MYDIQQLGVAGAPLETLQDLHAHLSPLSSESMVILITDTQDQRKNARYGILVRYNGSKVTVTTSSFGPRYGQDGIDALNNFVVSAMHMGVDNFKESVVNTYDFNRMISEPEHAEIEILLAKANPTDTNIYLKRG